MTLKMMAIGILVLLGLSSVMSPKTFRAFLGGLAALCFALFCGYFLFGGGEDQRTTPSIAQLQKMIGIQNYSESATRRSESILTEFKQGTLPPSPSDLLPDNEKKPSFKAKKVRRSDFIYVDANTKHTEILAKIQAEIERYLEDYRAEHGDVGVDRLTYRNIDPEFYDIREAKLKDGKVMFLLFDENFQNHVRAKGRHAITKQRLVQLALGLGAIGAVLVLSFAGLKFLNRRNEPLRVQDYLEQSEISMV